MILKLDMQHQVLEYFQIPSNDDPRLTYFFTQRSILVPNAFVWENAYMADYSETIQVYDIKVGIHSKLNEYREIYMYRRSRSFFELCPRSRIFH